MRWMAGLAALLVAGTVLAGCAAPEDDAAALPAPTKAPEKERLSRQGRGGGGDSDERDREPANVTLRSFAEEFDLTVTSATALIEFGSFDLRGCVLVDDPPFTILGGNATL